MTHKEKQLKQAEKELWRITNFSMSRYTDRQREMIDRINGRVYGKLGIKCADLSSHTELN